MNSIVIVIYFIIIIITTNISINVNISIKIYCFILLFWLSFSSTDLQFMCLFFFFEKILKAYQSRWDCACPGAGCQHMRKRGPPGRPNTGYHNHHNSPGRHCHLKNKHKPKQRYLQIFLPTGRTAVCVFIPLWLLATSLLETENIKFFFTAHSEPISSSSGKPVLREGIIFNHTSTKLWQTVEKRAIWHSFPFADIIRCVGNDTYEGGGEEKKRSFVRKLSLIELRHGDNNKVSFREGLKGIAWTNEIKTVL